MDGTGCLVRERVSIAGGRRGGGRTAGLYQIFFTASGPRLMPPLGISCQFLTASSQPARDARRRWAHGAARSLRGREVGRGARPAPPPGRRPRRARAQARAGGVMKGQTSLWLTHCSTVCGVIDLFTHQEVRPTASKDPPRHPPTPTPAEGWHVGVFV